MSGEAVGVGVAGPATSSTVGVAVAGAFAVAAGTCLVAGAGVYALAVVGRGAIRLGKDAYTSIDKQLNDHVNRQMILHQEKLRQHFSTNINIKELLIAPVDCPVPAAETIINPVNPLEELEKIIQNRIVQENDAKYSSTVSTEMRGELNKIKDMLESLHQNTTTSSASILGNKVRDQSLRDEVLVLADLTMPLYTDMAEKARSLALNNKTVANTLQREKISLQKKTKLMEQHAALFAQLARVKACFDNDPIIASSLPKADASKFKKEFENIRNIIETRGEGNIKHLEKLHNTMSDQAKILHDQKMFNDGVSLFQKAMENAGYTVQRVSKGDALILEGTNKQKVKTRIELGTPSANPDGKLRMNMEVDIEQKLTTPDGNGTQCDEAMQLLQREIDNVGLQVKIEDRTLRRAGKLLEGKAENTISEALAEIGVQNVKVTIHGDNGVDVNGSIFDFFPSDPVNFIAERIKSGLSGTRSNPERERLREKE